MRQTTADNHRQRQTKADRVATHCLRCENLIKERWEPTEPICANCALERELFDRESRLS